MLEESSAHDLGKRVRQAVATVLSAGHRCPEVRVVADGLGTSVRTLQRRLHAAGLTYVDLVQQARCEAARTMLKRRRWKIRDVARLLGYSDPAHFTRAFQRWMGTTPRAFRRGAEWQDRPGHGRISDR